MLVTLSGIVIAGQAGADRERLVPDAGRRCWGIDRDAGQAGAVSRTHQSPMLVTLLGIVTLVRLVQPENAQSRCW